MKKHGTTAAGNRRKGNRKKMKKKCKTVDMKGQCIEKRRRQQPRREKRVIVGSSVFRLAFNGTAGITYGIF